MATTWHACHARLSLQRSVDALGGWRGAGGGHDARLGTAHARQPPWPLHRTHLHAQAQRAIIGNGSVICQIFVRIVRSVIWAAA